MLFIAATTLMVVPLVRNRHRRTGVAELAGASHVHVANVITRVFERLRRFGDPVIRFASVNPGRASRLVALEATYQLFAVAEVYLTLSLIMPQNLGWSSAVWSSALVLETVSRAVTIMFKMLPMRLGVDE